jgi:hypothetical protein
MRFARAGMGYVGLWDAGGCEVTVDHLRRRSGELHGELRVASAVVARGRGHLHRASFNLSSTTARDRLVKMLTERSRPQDIPWGDYLEEFCTAVLEAERAGAPIVKVGNLEARPAESYLIDPFLPANKTTIVYGAGGTGKSYLADLVSVAVASGRDVLGWSVRPGSVLYLDWETDSYEIDERIKRVAAGLGVATPEILYRSCAAPLEDMAEDLSRTIADERVSLVIVDSVGMASGSGREGGDANESAIRLFSALRFLSTTVLAIDHITGEDVKSEKAVAKPYGSIYKVNLARSVWELRRANEQDDGTSHLGLFHRKVNKGRLLAPLGIRIEHGEHSVVFTREEVQEPSLMAAQTLSVRIERTLRGGAMTAKELADELDRTEAVVRSTLNRMKNQVARLPDGRWGLIARNGVTQQVMEVGHEAA